MFGLLRERAVLHGLSRMYENHRIQVVLIVAVMLVGS